ncbi:metal ABC transporter ATP-binding protein [Hyphomicrobium sp.]|uniref:metal ABC transporter ATP-binding protein n=1 Tax=Hyphomicrobium sp. TaxID=82 RepID=UPI002BE00D9B|nr:metal ABC transporter ATP-binding protein [Hyphomicrobium sp.]HVZ06105.1 metal ABC transporter ATP-binding protein [Hyphomicrobium sp.]
MHDHERPPAADALISARDLWFRRGGRDVIAGVNLDVRPGEIVTLIGPNGAGKTTLVRLVLGIEKPDRGGIVRPPSTRIGYVPQRFDVDRAIPMTVEGFLALGGTPSKDEIESALAEVGALRTMHQQLSRLSGGETQRVLIARALLRQPNLLILDEPARGVDFAGEAEFYELVGKLRDQRHLGILLVSHDLHVVMAKSDRVICLNGHVCCSGKPEHVSQHAEYARIFGPKGAAALGVYRHHHDHAHDLTGEPMSLGEGHPDDAESEGRGA